MTITDYRQLLGPTRGEAGNPLFRLDEVPEDGEMSFVGVYGYPQGLLVVRRGDQVFAYLNSCPHEGRGLDWEPGKFMNYENSMIICEAHGASFRIDDGFCTEGPCKGTALMPVPLEIRDGAAYAAIKP
jgi:nitrite reductase/ring-hydroxylating ferredoxin subunit